MDDQHEWADVSERDVLVLNYTMACPLSCDFCCYGCNPKRQEKMPYEKAKELIYQAAKLENFSSVGFTGGEVFLFVEELLALSDHLKSVNLPFTIVTAAHWGEDFDYARGIAEKLVKNGLRRANISFDYAHEKFVSRDKVENVCLAFAEQGIPVYVIGTFVERDTSLEKMVPMLSDVRNIKLISKQIAKVGRAKKANIDYIIRPFEDRNLSCYRRIYHDIVVFWDGSVYPCCSTFNRATKGIRVGNAFEESLEVIWERIEGSIMLRTIKRHGFQELYRIVDENGAGSGLILPDHAKHGGACSLCNSIFSKQETVDTLDSIFLQYEADQLVAASKEVGKLFGDGAMAELLQKIDSSRSAQEVENVRQGRSE